MAKGAGTASSTTAKAPASSTALASAKILLADSRSFPWTRKPPRAEAVCGVSPIWPITGIPARTMASMVPANSTPPSSFTASARPSFMRRTALWTASLTLT